MRIQHQDVNLNMQGDEIEAIKSELSSVLAKMNIAKAIQNPIPTENKLIDNLCNTIFEQKKTIAKLEGELHGMELAKNINTHIKRADELAGVK